MFISKAADADALQYISEIDDEWTDEVRNYGGYRNILSSDDERDSENPIYDVFYSASGVEKILKMTRFSPE